MSLNQKGRKEGSDVVKDFLRQEVHLDRSTVAPDAKVAKIPNNGNRRNEPADGLPSLEVVAE